MGLYSWGAYIRGAYIWDVNWVTYLGGVDSGGLHTGGALTEFYGIFLQNTNKVTNKIKYEQNKNKLSFSLKLFIMLLHLLVPKKIRLYVMSTFCNYVDNIISKKICRSYVDFSSDKVSVLGHFTSGPNLKKLY